MRERIEEMIKLLRQRVGSNLRDIKISEQVIREILKEEQSDERDDKLNTRYEYNKKLLDENNDSINLQLTLLRYLTKYRSVIEEEMEASVEIKYNHNTEGNDYKSNSDKVESNTSTFDLKGLGPDECFQLTIEGEIRFNKEHPYFENEIFVNRLLNHYLEKEDYEMCQFIKEIKGGTDL